MCEHQITHRVTTTYEKVTTERFSVTSKAPRPIGSKRKKKAKSRLRWLWKLLIAVILGAFFQALFTRLLEIA